MLPVPYAGVRLDRAPVQLTDARWLAAQAGTRPLTVGVQGRSVLLTQGVAHDIEDLEDLEAPRYLLGLHEERPVFAVDLGDVDIAPVSEASGADLVDVRAAFHTVRRDEAAIYAHAVGLVRWHRSTRFCSACGAATESSPGGDHRTCALCGAIHFPRIEPAVITLLESSEDPPRALLVQHHRAAAEDLSLVAGFVEIGESVEDAVVREALEEVGLQVRECTYVASQPWPFPAGLMLGFHAVVGDTDVRPVDGEIVSGTWFTPAELADWVDQQPPGDSIDLTLIQTWIGERRR